MNIFGNFFMFFGVLVLILVMVRLFKKNRSTNLNLKKQAREYEEKVAGMKEVSNDYGKRIKWAVDIEDDDKNKSSRRPEPPTGRGR